MTKKPILVALLIAMVFQITACSAVGKAEDNMTNRSPYSLSNVSRLNGKLWNICERCQKNTDLHQSERRLGRGIHRKMRPVVLAGRNGDWNQTDRGKQGQGNYHCRNLIGRQYKIIDQYVKKHLIFEDKVFLFMIKSYLKSGSSSLVMTYLWL